MIVLTPEELANFRAALAENADALRALDMVDDCEGELEDAAIALALQAGQEPDRSDAWLDGLAKRWRVPLCRGESHRFLVEDDPAQALQHFVAEVQLSTALATLVMIYVLKTGVKEFCKPLGELL